MTAPSDFVHLHVHSEYSMLDGCMKIDKLLDNTEAMGMNAVALTDHGGMFGSVEFYMKARKRGIKPIVGVEAYVARGSRNVKTGGKEEAAGINHLVLLAKDVTGYRNLMKLVTTAYVDGFYYKPRMDKSDLAAHSEGIICLSACLSGEIPTLLLADNYDKARRAIDEYIEIFGRDNYFLELQENTLDEQRKVNEGVLKLAKETGLPLVATNDCHYASQSDAEVHDILLCIQTNARFDDPQRMRLSAEEFFLKTPEQMVSHFNDVPESITNTKYVAEMCNLEIDLESKHMPAYQMPPEIKLSEREYLRKLAYDGAAERYPEITQEIRDRIDYELGILEQTNYESYFLIIRDVVMEARRRKISSGIRGSGNASVVAYCIGIIDLDPLEYKLVFERLLNPERVSPPDFDIDVSDVRRQEIIEYIVEKYGQDRVAQIATFSRLGPKAAVRDVGRALGISLADCDRIAKLIPEDPKMTMTRALDENPDLAQIRNSSPQYRRLFDTAQALEGITRQTSIHAAGIIVADAPLTNYTPLMRPKGGPLSTQYEFGILEDMGMFKIDVLGLKTLTQIEETCRLIKKRGVTIDRNKIPFDDAKTYELFQSARTNGVFQLESAGMRDILKRLKPTSVTDVIAIVALYRPGPMDMIPEFIAKKQGKQKVEYPLPELEPILAETYGIMVYQEQVMQIANRIAGMSLGQADIMRRAMGKKKPELLAEQKKIFVEGAIGRGVKKEVAEGLFDHIEKFAGYGFNKAHATAYGIVSYQTAYLKANYPVEFMAATLTNDMHDTEKILKYAREAREMGIAVLPPDINRSEEKFTAEEGHIRFGLGGIKNVGSGPIQSILAARKKGGPFQSLDDFCERVDLHVINSKTMECLIRCGAFDSLGFRRSQLLQAFPELVQRANSARKDQEIGQNSLFGMMPEAPKVDYVLPDVPELPEADRLQSEKELLGIYISGHPLQKHEADIRLFSQHTTHDINDPQQKIKQTRIVGVITKVERRTNQKGMRWARATLEDLEGTVEVTVFADTYQEYGQHLDNDKVVVVEGEPNDMNEGLIARRVLLVESAREALVRAVHIHLVTEAATENGGGDQLLKTLSDTIRRYKGNARLKLHLESPRFGTTVVETSDKWAVSPSQAFVEGVEAVLKPGAVHLDVAPIPNGGNGWNGKNRRQ